MEPLSDGVYDALVIDVTPADGGGARYELTLLDGPQKGAVVAVTSRTADPDDLSPMGVGATITVQGGRPSVHLDRA